MKKQLKKKWLKALRSGEYNQVKHSLRDTYYSDDYHPTDDGFGFCCLGVLCDVSGRGEWGHFNDFTFKLPRDKARDYNLESQEVVLGGTLHADEIPEFKVEPKRNRWGEIAVNSPVNKSLGLKGGAFVGVREYFGLTDKQHTKLMEMNDSGKSFSEIADWIEKHVKED